VDAPPVQPGPGPGPGSFPGPGTGTGAAHEADARGSAEPAPRPASAYRQEIGALVAVPRRDPLRLLQFWGLAGAFVGLQLWVVRAPSWWLAAPASVLLGLILVAMFCLLHELMHYAIIGSRPLTWLHGWIAGFYSGLTPDSWKHEHDAHHNALGTPIDDPDAVYDMAVWRELDGVRKGIFFMPGTRHPLSYLTRPLWWMAVHALLLFGRYLKQDNVRPWRKALAVAVWIFDVTAQLALIAWLGPRYAVWGFLVPIAVQNLLLMYFLLGTHLTCRRTEVKDPLLGSLSFRFFPLWRWAFLDAGRHVEHHLFPQTTHRKLREVTTVLRERYADRFNEVRFADSIRALEATGRVYDGEQELWDPRSGRRSSTYAVGLPPRSK
jgi:fatty acid desaturase